MGDTLPSAVRTRWVILFFRAFLFWLPTSSVSRAVAPAASGPAGAGGRQGGALAGTHGGAHSLALLVPESLGGARSLGNATRRRQKDGGVKSLA